MFVASMGCRLNQSDGAALAALFSEDGWRAVASAADADLVLLNGCTVTEAADRDADGRIRRLRVEAPGALLAVTGCLAQRDPERLAARADVDLVMGNGAKPQAAAIVRALLDGSTTGKIHLPDLDAGTLFFHPAPPPPGHTRAFLKVQEGCDRRCRYCIIPTTRGPERSVPAATVVAELARLDRLGIPEAILSGVHLGGWGSDLSPRRRLADLLAAIDAADLAIRLRISSLEPMELDDELLDVIAASRRIVPHLHLPLQSGSDRVLADMDRGYTAERFLDLAHRAAQRIAGLHLGTDLIVGYPTEGDADFEATLATLEASPVASLHVFPYSPRSGTPAALLPPLPPALVRGRSARARGLGTVRRRAFAQQFEGTTRDVLVLASEPADGGFEGITDHGLPVRIAADATPPLRRRAWTALRLGRFDGAAFSATLPPSPGESTA